MSLPEGVAELIAVKEARSNFVTDPDAAPGTYEWQLHRAWLELDQHRGRSVGGQRKVLFECAADILSRPAKPMQWTISGIIPEKSVFSISAEPKAAKTWAEIEIALAVANAVPAFGEFQVSEAGEVALFMAEDSEQSMRTRLAALAVGKGLDPQKATGRIHIQCRGHIDLQDDADVCAVIAAVRMLPRAPKLVALDPLRDIHGAEENDSGAMAHVMAQLRAIRDLLDCTVLFVHHSAKSSPDKSSRRAGQMMRGSSAIHGAVDGGFYMALKAHTESTLTDSVLVETKTGRAAGLFELTLNIRDDANGEATWALWTYSREVRAKAAPAAEELGADIQAALAEKPDSGSGLALRLSRRTQAVLQACKELETGGDDHEDRATVAHPFPRFPGSAGSTPSALPTP